jgi:hypothetical protein
LGHDGYPARLANSPSFGKGFSFAPDVVKTINPSAATTT